MADVFISYAREDRSAAERVAEAIGQQGWSVWWDRKIRVGRSFSRVIEHELNAARCVVVLWSRASIESDWVLSEAEEGATRKILVPIRIDDVRPPLEFRRLHTATLLSPPADLSASDFAECLSAIRELIGAPVATSAQTSAASARNAHENATPVARVASRSKAPSAGTPPLQARSNSDLASQTPRTVPVRASEGREGSDRAVETATEKRPTHTSSRSTKWQPAVAPTHATVPEKQGKREQKPPRPPTGESPLQTESLAAVSHFSGDIHQSTELGTPPRGAPGGTAPPRSNRSFARQLTVILLFVVATVCVGLLVLLRQNSLRSSPSDIQTSDSPDTTSQPASRTRQTSRRAVPWPSAEYKNDADIVIARDPFRSLIRPASVATRIPGIAGFNIASLQLQGVFRTRTGLAAMVNGPDGKGYIIRAGDALADGKVQRVDADKITFVTNAGAEIVRYIQRK